MKSLKYTEEEIKARKGEMTVMEDEDYPWGMSLNISDETYDKLDASRFKLGDEVIVVAKAKVESVSSHESSTSSDNSLRLQLTDAELAKSDNDKLSRMFPK